MIADGKFWSRDGEYNAKDAFNDKFDRFVQIQIDVSCGNKINPSKNLNPLS